MQSDFFWSSKVFVYFLYLQFKWPIYNVNINTRFKPSLCVSCFHKCLYNVLAYVYDKNEI